MDNFLFCSSQCGKLKRQDGNSAKSGGATAALCPFAIQSSFLLLEDQYQCRFPCDVPATLGGVKGDVRLADAADEGLFCCSAGV